MKIKVEYKSTLLGEGGLWQGDSKNISQIRNFVARDLATMVAGDGKTRVDGMWTVSKEAEDENNQD